MRNGCLTLGVLALGAALGCGGIFPEEENEQPYRVALMVSDLEGQALADASVWIDNQLMEERTAASYTLLGSGYPSEWQGWPANYTSHTLCTTIDFAEDVDHIEIIVARTGYRVSRAGFDLGDVSGTFFFRAAMPMEPSA